jgi:hypothetical protein
MIQLLRLGGMSAAACGADFHRLHNLHRWRRRIWTALQGNRKRIRGFDLALLEDGQYDKAWRYIHMMPEETLRAADDLRAIHLVPVHNSKFCIANHDWDAPPGR